jgi:hypothetical protein
MKILNSDELETWLFDHANIQGHRCNGIKGTIQSVNPGDNDAELVNVSYVDTVTGEKFDVIYI